MGVKHTIVPDKIINGSFGELYDSDGRFVGNCQSVEYRIVNEKKEWRPIGSRRVAFKLTGTKGEGTLRLFKIDSHYLTIIGGVMWDETSEIPVTSLTMSVDDPESDSTEVVILHDVKFWELAGGWKVNELVIEEIQFTFQSISTPIKIENDKDSQFLDRQPIRYVRQFNL